MNDNEASLQMFDQEKLAPEVRDAALAAALAVLSREGVSASAAVHAYSMDLMLAAVSEGAEHTDDHYRERGASLHAFEAYHASKGAAEAEIARLDPANASFKILFPVAG
jgi:hypothetical protein